MDDLYGDLMRERESLRVSLKQLRKNGVEKAETERKYKCLLAEECLKLKNDGMAIGLIDKVCYGIPEVAAARFKRDVAETVYKANLEAINVYKLNVRIIEEQIKREWGSDE